MSAPVITRPSLLEVVLDALTDAFYARRAGDRRLPGLREELRASARI